MSAGIVDVLLACRGLISHFLPLIHVLAIRWLGDLVQEKRKMALLTVTHDRAFLAEVCNSILELDRGTFYSHPGSYQTYLEVISAIFAFYLNLP